MFYSHNMNESDTFGIKSCFRMNSEFQNKAILLVFFWFKYNFEFPYRQHIMY